MFKRGEIKGSLQCLNTHSQLSSTTFATSRWKISHVISHIPLFFRDKVLRYLQTSFVNASTLLSLEWKSMFYKFIYCTQLSEQTYHETYLYRHSSSPLWSKWLQGVIKMILSWPSTRNPKGWTQSICGYLPVDIKR